MEDPGFIPHHIRVHQALPDMPHLSKKGILHFLFPPQHDSFLSIIVTRVWE